MNHVSIRFLIRSNPQAAKVMLWVGQSVLSLVLGTAWWAVTRVVALLPIYKTAVAVQSKEKSSMQYWFAYWICMTPLLVLEFSPLMTLLEGNVFYQIFRTAYGLALMLPQTDLAQSLYGTLVFPFLCEHESKIDASLLMAKSAVGEHVSRLRDKSIQVVKEQSVNLLIKSHGLLANSNSGNNGAQTTVNAQS